MGARARIAAGVKADPFLARVRKLCLSLPETEETSSWGHANFRAGKRTLLTFETFGGAATIAFCLHSFEVEELQKRPGFTRTPYGQGRWVSLKMRPRPRWAFIEALVIRSYQRIALKRMIRQLETQGAL